MKYLVKANEQVKVDGDGNQDFSMSGFRTQDKSKQICSPPNQIWIHVSVLTQLNRDDLTVKTCLKVRMYCGFVLKSSKQQDTPCSAGKQESDISNRETNESIKKVKN